MKKEEKEKKNIERTFAMGCKQWCIYLASIGFFSFFFYSTSFFFLLAVPILHRGTTNGTSCMSYVYRLKERNRGRNRSIFLRNHVFLFNILFFIQILSMTRTSRNLFLIVLLSLSADGFYLPGLAPNVFCKNPVQDSKCKVS
jgi:hypothetical protein